MQDRGAVTFVTKTASRMREPNLPTDPEASRERFATCRQSHGNREGPTFLSVSVGRREAAHHPGVVGVLFRPSIVFAKGAARLPLLSSCPPCRPPNYFIGPRQQFP
jgi:hypothetical protein